LKVQVLSLEANGSIRMQWGNSLLKAQLPPPLPAVGEQLTLKLTAIHPQPQLLVVSAGGEPPEGQWLSQRLPKAQDLGNLLLRLASIQRQEAQVASSPTAAATPQALLATEGGLLQPLVQLLRTHVLSRGNLTPVMIREALLGSGLFLEANLAQGRQPPANDLKLALLRMLDLLQPLPTKQQAPLLAALLGRFGAAPRRDHTQERPGMDAKGRTLLQSIEGALAKVELQQLNSLPQRDDGRLQWQFSLPLGEDTQHASLGIEIERESAKQPGEEEPGWKVNLHFPFAESGSLDAHLSLRGEDLSLNFWAEREETLNKLREALPQLEKALVKAGFHLTQCQTYPGRSPHQPTTPNHQQPLLREKA
jgi:hypothetical protein